MECMSSDADPPGKDEIAREILAYLADHPDAGDTLEGIVVWWLLEGRINSNKHLAISALDDLVSKGFVYKLSRGAFPSEYYCINKDKQDQIAKLVKASKTS
jgi:hypothetical protein